MGIFGKRDEDYEYEDENRSRKIPKDKDFRDLKPENRKKRKEPPKPWGKFERFLIISVIVLTVGTSAFLSLSSREWKLPNFPRINFPSLTLPDFSSFGQKTIIIETSKKDVAKANEAISAFKEKTRSLSGVYGLYVVRLENGFSYGVNEDEVFQAASLIKLPVIAGMYMESEAGRLDLDEKYTLKKEDKVAGSGSLYGKPVGFQITYRNLLELMGKQSDNTAFNISRNFLGDEKISQVITKIGMSKTNILENETTPSDIGDFFEELWRGNIVSDESRDAILESLTETIYEDHLRAGIPEGIRVSHKYGREIHVINDAGMVFTDKPFVIVIMTKGIVEKEADTIFPELAKVIYEIEKK